MAKVAKAPASTSRRSARASHFSSCCKGSPRSAVGWVERTRNPSAESQMAIQLVGFASLNPPYDASILQQLERGVEDLARLGVALGLHALHPVVPDRLAAELAPALELVGRRSVAVELVVARLDPLQHGRLGRIEEIAPPELRAGEPA